VESKLNSSNETGGRLQILDALRGLAALSVVWFHLAHSMGLTKEGTQIYRAGTYGWVGVEVFFVMSGFVIPFTLEKNRYRIAQYGRFLAKRVIRLDPPYLVSIASFLALAAYFSVVSHTPFRFSGTQVLLHLGYLNVFFGYEWIDNVYWTLAIEVQYYVIMGVVFPLVARRRTFWWLVVPAAFGLMIVFPSKVFIFCYTPFFMLGLAAFHYRRGTLSKYWFLLSAMGFALCAVPYPGWVAATICLLAALAIAFGDGAPWPLVSLGTVSYSLYLIHGAVGYTALSVTMRHAPWIPQLAAIGIAMFSSIVAAWVLYELVEKPSQRLSSRIRYYKAMKSDAVKDSAIVAEPAL
jgi:peptidoglycan/LPS O-acetylase OafA/YrhL